MPGRPTDQRSGAVSDMQRLYERVTDAFGEQRAWELFSDVLGYVPEGDSEEG